MKALLKKSTLLAPLALIATLGSTLTLTSQPAVAQAPTSIGSGQDPARWPSEKVWQWYNSQPWLCGFNYVPSNAISYTEMFMPYNFDAARIDKEMAQAQGVGLNCARIVLPFVVWEHDPAVFKKELSSFLDVCSKRGIKVTPALFDDCVFGTISDPVYGPQPDVVPGWYANGWTPSPGHSIVRDKSQWPRLEKYVKDLLTTYKTDKRILMWDLYNEPTNGGIGEVTVPLVNQVFDWARQVAPDQPLTVDTFGSQALRELTLQRSDVITFHNYEGPASLEAEITQLQRTGRPVVCTEWLNRNAGSTVVTSLPIFVAKNAGCFNWGLVNGKTQTDLNWGHRPGQPLPAKWQHDLFRADYTPYDSDELNLFKRFIAVSAALRKEGEG